MDKTTLHLDNFFVCNQLDSANYNLNEVNELFLPDSQTLTSLSLADIGEENQELIPLELNAMIENLV